MNHHLNQRIAKQLRTYGHVEAAENLERGSPPPGAKVGCPPDHVLVQYETDGGWAWGCQTCADNIRRQYAKNLGWRRTLNQLRLIRKYQKMHAAHLSQNAEL